MANNGGLKVLWKAALGSMLVAGSLRCSGQPPQPPAPAPVVTIAAASTASAVVASAPDRAEPARPACPRIDLGICTGAAKFLAGCPSGGPAGMRVETMIVPAVAERIGPCLAEATHKDDHCADDLHRCVRESVLAAARPTPADEQACQSLDAACRKANHPPNYTKEQCAKVLAASQPGPTRAQVEQALGPSSEEPAPCNIHYIWPNMPFTPYFP